METVKDTFVSEGPATPMDTANGTANDQQLSEESSVSAVAVPQLPPQPKYRYTLDKRLICVHNAITSQPKAHAGCKK